MKRRYIVASLAFCGFCVIYMLRVNLSVAIVAMTANRTHENTDETHQIAIVSCSTLTLILIHTHSTLDVEQLG